MKSHKNDFLLKQTVSPCQQKGTGKTLILIETEAQVKDCLSWLDDLKCEKLLIAVTPFAMYELDRHGMKYMILEDYYDSQELYHMGLDNFRKVEDLCTLIDTAIHQTNSKIAGYNIKPAMFSYLDLKVIYDSVTIHIFQLSKMINTEKPDFVYVYDSDVHSFDPDNVNKSNTSMYFDVRESICTRVISLNGWNTQVKILPKISQCSEDFVTKEKGIYNKISKVKTWLKTHPDLFGLALIIQKHCWRGIIEWIKNLNTKKRIPILLYGAGYNWDDCYVELMKGGIGPIYRISYDFVHRNPIDRDFDNLNFVWGGLQNNPDFKKFFVYMDIDFYPIFKDRFEFLVKRISVTCAIDVHDTMILIDKKKIKAVVSSTFSSFGANSAAQAAHNSGIPVFTWQHGGYGAMEKHPFAVYTELINTDVNFVFGDGVVESHIQEANRYGTEMISIGSSSIEYIKNSKSIKKEHSATKVILYATSTYNQNNLSISTPPPFLDTSFWCTQQAIVDVLGKYDDCSIIIKLHPTELSQLPPLKAYIKDREFNNIKFIHREKTFTELLNMVDIVVIDMPCTTILQALTTEKPIFAYTGHIYYNEHAQRLLSKRAICSQELSEFLFELNRYLSKNLYEPDVNNTEFLKMYGITSKEGTAGVRVSKELKRIINNFHLKINSKK